MAESLRAEKVVRSDPTELDRTTSAPAAQVAAVLAWCDLADRQGDGRLHTSTLRIAMDAAVAGVEDIPAGVSAAVLRRLRARISSGALSPAERSNAAWAYRAAWRRSPLTTRMWSRRWERGSRAERRARRESLEKVLTWEVR